MTTLFPTVPWALSAATAACDHEGEEAHDLVGLGTVASAVTSAGRPRTSQTVHSNSMSPGMLRRCFPPTPSHAPLNTVGDVQYSPALHIWAPISVPEVQRLLAGSTGRWWLSGGQAIDHWLGRTTRPHGDIDVSVVRAEWARLIAELPSHLEPYAAIDGNLLALADWADSPRLRNIWLRDSRTDRWVLQVNIEEGDAAWRYRRQPWIELSWHSAVRIVRGVPTGSPATQLLWKSPSPRPRDDADLDVTLPVLSSDDRAWLLQSIRLAHPSSPWLSDDRISE